MGRTVQVEGKAEVSKRGRPASPRAWRLIEAAIEAQADAILVHHGLFWRGHDGRVTGWLKARAGETARPPSTCLPTTCRWTRTPSWATTRSSAPARWAPTAASATRISASSARPEQPLTPARCRPCSSASAEAHGRRAWRRSAAQAHRPGCTGGAQGYFEAAIAAGPDAFITGEISEPQAHYARETGVAFLACGHHASERYGAPAVAAVARPGLEHQFIDIDNPA